MKGLFRQRISVVAIVALMFAACSGTAGPEPTTAAPASEQPIPITIPAAAEPTSTEPPAPSTTSTMKLDESIDESSAALAVAFLEARDDRDLETALGYLDRNVVFDWGPGQTYDTLESGWAWEDAFRLVHTTDSCETVGTSGETTTVVCRIKVDSEVATAAGNSPGHVCATIAVVDQLITHLTVDAGLGCSYIYWPNMFAPFEIWLKTAHPDTTIGAMYNDRISETGLELWTIYTQEFLAVHG
jgi:hypothetical protein